MGIDVLNTPPYSSTVNGQVERFHSTLSKIMIYLKPDNTHVTFEELLYKSLKEHNSTVLIKTFFGNRVFSDSERQEEFRKQNVKQVANLS